MKKTIFALCFVLIVSLTSCVTDYSLISSEKTKNKIYFEEGNEYQVANAGSSLEVKAAGLDSINGSNAVLVGIDNKSEDSEYSFQDSQIKIYGGNADRNQWSLIGTWNAKDCFSEMVENAESQKRAVAVLGVLSVVDAALSPDTVISFYDDSYYSFSFYSPTDVLFTALLADEINRDVSRELSRNLNLVKKTMLFSSTIKPSSSYSGILYFPMDRTYPDYRIDFTDKSNKLHFTFSRTDREELIHPWTADRKRDQFAFAYAHSFTNDKNSLDFLWLPPKSVGIYNGLSFYPVQSLISYDIGLTFKLCPHTWLLAGCELGGDTSDDIPEENMTFICAPQVGVDFSYNWLDCIFKVSYDVMKQAFSAEAGMGVTV